MRMVGISAPVNSVIADSRGAVQNAVRAGRMSPQTAATLISAANAIIATL